MEAEASVAAAGKWPARWKGPQAAQGTGSFLSRTGISKLLGTGRTVFVSTLTLQHEGRRKSTGRCVWIKLYS